MGLVSIEQILKPAREGHYAVPAFDVADYRMARAVVDVAEELRAPVILMGLPGDLTEEQFDHLSIDLHSIAVHASVPVCIHLDHATDISIVKKAVAQGYSSVMIDGSALPFEENVRITKEVTDYAHAYGVSVEAELGHVGDGIVGSSSESAKGNGGHASTATDPEELRKFLELTCVDCLAVSFGTSHGVYKCKPHLDLELLSELDKVSSVPLVVHGGSGTPEDQLKEAVSRGICKVNVFSEIVEAFWRGMKEFLNEQENLSLWTKAVYQKPIEEMKKTVREKFLLFGTDGKV